MHWQVLAAFAATTFLFALTPGPAVLLTVGHGMKSGWLASFKAALGVQAGNAVYFLLSVLGLGALLVASEPLFHAVKYLGAAYLAYLGVKTIANARKAAEKEGFADRPPKTDQGTTAPIVSPARRAGEAGAQSPVFVLTETTSEPEGEGPKLGQNPFWQAAIMQLANPKSVLFFGALMPQFIDPKLPQLPQYAAFATICFVAEVPVLAVYGWLAAQGRRLSAKPKVVIWRERLSGACLLGVGASLALIRRAA